MEKLSRELSELLKVKVEVAAVSGTDHFYTDGLTIQATYRIGLPDSSMNYVRRDGTTVLAWSPSWAEVEETIRVYLSTVASGAVAAGASAAAAT
jgi:hypothetical protein